MTTNSNKIMENNSLFPLKYRIRKTDEPVEIVAWETAEKGARSETDWVSYIDTNGVEHIKEHLTLEWDFVTESPFGGGLLSDALSKIDPWESRRYEMVQKQVIENGLSVELALIVADSIIASLKKSPEEATGDDGYDNIGIGEIVESVSEDGKEYLKKFVFRDRKDIVGFRGDCGRWSVGDRVKVYIKPCPEPLGAVCAE